MTRHVSLRPTLPASLLNFLAGLFAAAGISLLIAVETSGTSPQSDGKGQSTGQIAIDATVWIAASIFQAWAAHIAEKVDQEANLVIDANIERPLRKLVRADVGREWARPFWILMGLTAACVSAAIALIVIPNS
jgi:hypothetical protein